MCKTEKTSPKIKCVNLTNEFTSNSGIVKAKFLNMVMGGTVFLIHV